MKIKVVSKDYVFVEKEYEIEYPWYSKVLCSDLWIYRRVNAKDEMIEIHEDEGDTRIQIKNLDLTNVWDAKEIFGIENKCSKGEFDDALIRFSKRLLAVKVHS